MKSIIKGIAAVAACAMTVTGLAACGSSSASGEKKLDFITGMATGSVHLKTLQSITDAFEKENPGVKINLIPSSQDFTQDIKVRLAQGTRRICGTPTVGRAIATPTSLSRCRTAAGPAR